MTVEFVTIDGEEDVSLKVRVFRPDDTELKELVIVLVHQYTFVGGNQGLVKGLANELAAKGYVCVTFDMRGAGRSTGRPSITGTAEVQDVVTVCRWAASHLRAPRILVSGTSVGMAMRYGINFGVESRGIMAADTVYAELSLKVRVFRPDETETRDAVIVLVHQHTLFGGNQGLVMGLANQLAAKGFVTVTFDMRGAGRSTGRASITGTAEVQDVVTVCRWAASHLPAPRIVVSGSSVGATISGAAIDQVEQVIGYVGLGYPFGWLGWLFFGQHKEPLLNSKKPKLFVMGERDGFTSVRQFRNALKLATGRIVTHLLPKVGHFQMERPSFDATLAEKIGAFATSLE